jgi:phospholipid transport system substrate-binding protein
MKSVKALTKVFALSVVAALPLVALTARAADDAAQVGPQELVTKVAQDTLRDLDAHRAEYKQNPKRVRELVDKNMLPHFDTTYAAQLVLAKYWRTATPEQRKRFVDAFYHSLLNNYGAALVDFTSDKLKIYPTNVEPSADRATVRSEIKRDTGDTVSVNYQMRKTPQGWKAVDVVIDGISYVKSYHDDFGAQIDQQGLDAVISRLEKGEKPSDISKTVKKPS